MKRGALLGLSAAVLATAAAAALLAGCGHKDDTMTAAPPAGPNAHPLPTVQRRFPRVKIAPLVGKDGKRTGGGDI